MAPFVYQPFSSPFANTIAQLLLHQNDPAMQAVQTAALANAHAGEVSANAWSGAVQNIANAAGGVAKEIVHQQEIAPQLAMQKLQLAQAQHLQAGKDALATALAGNTLSPTDVGPALPTFRSGENQPYDIPAIADWLNTRGYGDVAPDLVAHAETLNKTLADAQTAKEAADMKRTVWIGGAVQGALKLNAQVGMPLDAALTATASPGLGTQVTKQQLDTVVQTMNALPPDQQRAFLQHYVDAADQAQKPITLKEGEAAYGATSRTQMFAAPEKADLASLAKDAATVGTARETPTARDSAVAVGLMKPKPPERAPTPLERVNVMLDGRNAEVLVDRTPGGTKVYDLNGRPLDNPAGRITGIPAASLTIRQENANAPRLPAWALDDSRPSGPDANTPDPVSRWTPNGLYQAAQLFITTGQLPSTARASDPVSAANREALMAKVGAISAASGMDEHQLRAFYQTQLPALRQMNQVYAQASANIATADRNAALLETALGKMPDTGSPLLNQPLRAFEKSVVGNVNMAPIATYLASVQNEYGKLIQSATGTNNVLTDNARHEMQALIDPNATVNQMIASMRALRAEGENRLLSTGEQIKAIQGHLKLPSGTDNAPAGPRVGEIRTYNGETRRWDGPGAGWVLVK